MSHRWINSFNIACRKKGQINEVNIWPFTRTGKLTNLLKSYLSGHGMRLAELVAPEAPPHRHDGQLGEDDGTPERR